MSSNTPISPEAARQALGVAGFLPLGDLRRAFRDAAKAAHPDRAGGDAERFRRVVEAYHRLRTAQSLLVDSIILPPAPRAPEPAQLIVEPLVALRGGSVAHQLAAGRAIRIQLPPGLRAGDIVRTAGAKLHVAMSGTAEMLVRGDDLWVSARVPPGALDAGGRIAIETPLGRRIVWLTRKAGERGLLRLVGQGLPARGRHRQGHIFLRLTPEAGEAHSAARALLRRFTAAWAA